MRINGVLDNFTRAEVMEVTGLDSNRLSYLERTGLVIPKRIGSGKKPTVVYSWIQLVQLMILTQYRDKFKNKTLKRIVDFLGKPENFPIKDFSYRIYVINDEIEDDEKVDMVGWMFHDGLKLNMEGMDETIFDLSVFPPVKIFISKMIDNASKSTNLVDVESLKDRLLLKNVA